jgi:hypothetical protein
MDAPNIITAGINPAAPLPPKDYSAAYVEELVNQLSNAESQIQWHLDLSRELLTKIRTQIAPH